MAEMKMEIISSSFFLLILLVGIILLIIYFINPSLLGIKPNTTGGNETGGRTYQRPTIVDWGTILLKEVGIMQKD